MSCGQFAWTQFFVHLIEGGGGALSIFLRSPHHSQQFPTNLPEKNLYYCTYLLEKFDLIAVLMSAASSESWAQRGSEGEKLSECRAQHNYTQVPCNLCSLNAVAFWL